MAVKPIPDGYHNVTPFLSVKGAGQLIDFVKKAYGAKERMRMPGPDGGIMHAEVQIGDSIIMLTEAMREAPMPAYLYLYVNDTDATYKRAIEAGAVSQMEPADMFWGDRHARVQDPFGNSWSLATHKEDLSPEEVGKRAAQAMGGTKNV